MISICIPVYEMHGHGVEMLRELIASIWTQTFQDYEVIISDDNCGLLKMSSFPFEPFPFGKTFKGLSFYEGKQGASANLNNTIAHARGDIIKPMFQDDYFVAPDTLAKMVAALDNDHHWAFATSTHSNDRADHIPYPHRNERELALGENTYGCPSAAIWKRSELRFDERLIWLMDCEFYARMFREYGAPALLPDVKVGIREWEGQQTNTAASGQVRLDENVIVGAMYP